MSTPLASAASPWLMRFARRPAATARLFCLSYAGGGGAVYRPFALGLSEHVEVLAVSLPGREARLREPPLRSIDAIVQALVPQITPEIDRPYALFGHSMGALVAFELARALVADGHRGPSQLIVSARRAPHLTEIDTALSALPDDVFVAEIDRRYGGIPAEVRQYREILELLLPALRADMAAIEAYRHHAGPPLLCPITALGGSGDARTPPEVLRAWNVHSAAGCTVEHFAGGHFYFSDAAVRVQLLATLDRLLAPLAQTPAALAAQGSAAFTNAVTAGAALVR